MINLIIQFFNEATKQIHFLNELTTKCGFVNEIECQIKFSNLLPTTDTNFILLESGFYTLLENGDKILLE